jgi:phosphopantothenoylcysteine decarboxylase/phosphopantothenate--cysteine ligase
MADGPFTIGFAAETEQLRKYALGKLDSKNLDMIVANKVGVDRGFDSDVNTVEVYWRGGEQSFPTADKSELAEDLIRLIADRYDVAETDKSDDKWPRAVRD